MRETEVFLVVFVRQIKEYILTQTVLGNQEKSGGKTKLGQLLRIFLMLNFVLAVHIYNFT